MVLALTADLFSAAATAFAFRSVAATKVASRFGAKTNLSTAKKTKAAANKAIIKRSMRRAVCGAIDSSGATSASRFKPSGVSSNIQANESNYQENNDTAGNPAWRSEHRQHGTGHLRDQPSSDQIQARHTDDVAALEFADDVHLLVAISMRFNMAATADLLLAISFTATS
mgnify:CR=1 FL=1